MTPKRRESISVVVVGARGFVGQELLALLSLHPNFQVIAASSRELAGRPISSVVPTFDSALAFCELAPDDLASCAADAYILALPNHKSGAYLHAIQQQASAAVVLDLSADHRFDDEWCYGLPELHRAHCRGATRIANPGCYATAVQLGLAPLLGELASPPSAFGISGYSGAGTTPSPKNDPEVLRDNVLPYALVGHIHEREVTRHLSHPVRFLPHVAPWFRGITVTLQAELKTPSTAEGLYDRYASRYAHETLVRVQRDAPRVRDIAGQHHVEIGGFTCSEDGHHVALVATIDNLLKGAATQALQNLNLAFALDEFCGVPVPDVR